MNMFVTYLGRGMLAGLLAGLLAGSFAYLFGEPAIDRALLLEDDSGSFNEVVGRDWQKVGLVVATMLYGGAVGGIFAVVFSWVRGRAASGSDWSKSLRLSLVMFCGIFFIPFVKYPSDPPGTGDSETLGVRTAAYLLLIVISLAAILGAWYLARLPRVRRFSTPVRHVVVGGSLVAVIGSAYLLLPPATAVGEFPGQILWDFRRSTFATQVLLWGGIGIVFGFLCERDSPARTPAASLSGDERAEGVA